MSSASDRPVLTVSGTLTSLFHTSQTRYPSLYKCAPYIPGPSFRGAVLSYLIQTRCPEDKLQRLRELRDRDAVAEFHRSCELDCIVKHCFAEPPAVCFGFGRFPNRSLPIVRSRVAIGRDNRSAAEGSLLALEAMPPGQPFDSTIVFLDKASKLKDPVLEALRVAGEFLGVGRFRSLGFGRFRIRDDQTGGITEQSLEEAIEANRMTFAEGSAEVAVTLETPLVTDESFWSPDASGPTAFVDSKLKDNLHLVGDTPPDAGLVGSCGVDGFPSIYNRFSYETGRWESRPVAREGSRLFITPAEGDTEPLSRALAVAQLLGLGEWHEVGFGQLYVT